MKYAKDASDEWLRELANAVLKQIVEKGYDKGCVPPASGRAHFGIAFSGKHMAVVSERLD